MSKRYNVYFSGQVIQGHDPAQVRQNLGKLFKADEATLDKLFAGKPRLIKRDCDADTARKYRDAMERAGATPLIEAVPDAAASTPPAGKPSSAAEKIAALAAAPDDARFSASAQAPTGEAEKAGATESQADADTERGEAPPAASAGDNSTAEGTSEGPFDLAPPRSEVLRKEERSEPESREVDTSHIDVDNSGAPLAPATPPSPPAPDTSHLDMAAAGEAIPNLPSTETPLSPDTSALDLSPEGTDFSDCQAPEPAAPELDLSGMEVAPQGADVLEERYRSRNTASAPDTGHITLED